MSDQYSRPSDSISINQIPKFEFELRNDELVNCIKELSFNLKTQDKNIQKIKKDVESRTTQSQLTEALVFINSLIDIDPALGKQLKSKTNKKEELAANPINNSAGELGKKINQISQSISLLHNSIKGIEKRLTDFEFASKSALSQKVNLLQQQIDENNSKANSEAIEIRQKIQINSATFSDKVREVETKTLWQINDCKMRLNSCINEQYVKDIIKELQGRMTTKMKEEMLKQGSIEPQRIDKIQQNILKNEKDFASQMTETNYKIQVVKDHIEKALMTKKQFGDQRIEIQKRFGLANNNLGDVLRRVRQIQGDLSEEKSKSKKTEEFSEAITKQTNRMNQVLKNLKIGDDFQKMLQKMDPHRVCELDDRVEDLTLNQEKLNKVLDLTQKQVDRLRSKTEFTGILAPSTNSNSNNQKMSKEEIQSIIHEYFTNNLFAKKLQVLQSQSLQVKAFPEMVNNINKQLARMQKQTDTHNLIYQLKGLQQYVKKQILIVNNRINNIEAMLKQEKKRPTSAVKTTLSETKLGSSVSYKKLTPVNCISCYTSSPGTNGFGVRKNIISQKL